MASIRKAKKGLVARYGRKMARQVTRTTKGYARSRKLVRRERYGNAGSGMGNIINIALFGAMAYVAYEMLINKKTLGQAIPFLNTTFGIAGMSSTQAGLGFIQADGLGMYADGRALSAGMNGIAPTSLYGGYAPMVTSSVSTRSERMIGSAR